MKTKHISIAILIIFCFATHFYRAKAQDNLNIERNYVKKTTVLKKGRKTDDAIKNLDHTGKAVTVEYIDGLGRPDQVIQIKGAAENQGVIKDIVSPIEYDNYGIETRKYLPYATPGNEGSYISTDLSDQRSYLNGIYGADGTYGYSETILENSPLNRPVENGAPGADWQKSVGGHTVKILYSTNAGNNVRHFSIMENQLVDNDYYLANELLSTITKDENWTSGNLHTTEEYKDKLGQMLLKRSYVMVNNVVTPVETYYVYDDYGLLRYVIPPEAIKQMYSEGQGSMDNFRLVNGDEILNENLTGNMGFMLTSGSSLTLTPGFSFTATSTESLSIAAGHVSADLVYYYEYDKLNRMIEKKIPGAAPVYLVYDDRDRLVATQDGEMREKGEWLFTKYDALNRPVMTGIVDNDITTQIAMQTAVDTFYPKDANGNITSDMYETATGTVHGYTNNSFPNVSAENAYLTVTYYDDYKWLKTTDGNDVNEWNHFSQLKNLFNAHPFTGVAVPSLTVNQAVKGQVTGAKTKVLEEGTDNWLESITYYDDRYRPILAHSSNYVGGYDMVLNDYDFVGKIEESWQLHVSNKPGNIDRFVRQVNDYDHAGRLLNTKQQLTDATTLITIAENTYNELGELINKKVGETSSGAIVQQMDYRYNIRGWMTAINEDQLAGITGERKFAMKLHYNSGLSGIDEQVQYNGNIAAMEWRAPAQTNIGITGDKQAYGFYYDGLNRLTDANYGTGSTLSNSTWANAFTVSGIKYDLNGNIQELNRERKVPLTKNNVNNITSWGKRSIDQLIYNYSGNQLMAVTEGLTSDEKDYTATKLIKDYGFKDGNTTGVDYDYDLNGNMTTDRNKGLQDVQYNHLNLPKKLIGTNNEIIEYIYDANGQKLKKIAPDGSATYYSGLFIYQGNNLDYILHAEGKYKLGSTDGGYHYNVSDHLGNVRLVVKADANRTILDQTDYYPFGMAMNMSLFGSGQKNLYKYNGKELQDDAIGNGSLDWYDYGARFYDPTIGRFFTQDRFAEKYMETSPYHYALNNPIL
ncbi:MAG: DUF6443 domain-containing protein, partial [Carboxylicivirga sp.]|nr:DUF6443 domain-containing protein [Carboxylicivirga sp.]